MWVAKNQSPPIPKGEHFLDSYEARSLMALPFIIQPNSLAMLSNISLTEGPTVFGERTHRVLLLFRNRIFPTEVFSLPLFRRGLANC